MNSIGYLWHLGSSSKLQLSPTKSSTQYHLTYHLNWATTILPASFVRPVLISLHNPTRILSLAPLLFNHLHLRFGTNCPLKSSLHTHSRLLWGGLKLIISTNHLPRSRASPRLRFVPYRFIWTCCRRPRRVQIVIIIIPSVFPSLSPKPTTRNISFRIVIPWNSRDPRPLTITLSNCDPIIT